jgi:phosphoglycolate phosphatase
MSRLVIFDLDGTLVDSRRDLADSANILVAEHGGTPLSVDAIVSMVGEGVRVLLERVASASGAAFDLDAAVAQFLEIYGERLLVHTRPYPGVTEVLPALQSRAVLAVVSNKPESPSRAVLEGLGLARHFRYILGGDGQWPRKPAPDVVSYLIGACGATPRATMFVGDSMIDLLTARRAGTRMALVQWGFGFQFVPSGALDESVTVVEHAEDLLPLLDELSQAT